MSVLIDVKANTNIGLLRGTAGRAIVTVVPRANQIVSLRVFECQLSAFSLGKLPLSRKLDLFTVSMG